MSELAGRRFSITLDELPALIVRNSVEQRRKAELSMFEAGIAFEEIAEHLDTMREIDEAIAFGIRDRLPQMRQMTGDELATAFDDVWRQAFDRVFS